MTSSWYGGQAWARPAAGEVCLVSTAAADGLEPSAVRAALLLEARKLGRAAHVVQARSAARCADAALVVSLGPGARATVGDGAEDGRPFDLSETLPVERARSVARAALAALLARTRSESPEVLIDLSAPVTHPQPAAPGHPSGVAGEATVGGGYARFFGTDTDHGFVDAELAVALFDGRLAFGVAGTWMPEVEVDGGEPVARLTGGELRLTVRGGLEWGPVLIRLGLGGGYQWRRLAVRSAYRFDDAQASSGAAVVSVEAELVWRPSPPFSIHLLVPGRVYLGGVSHRWKGRALQDAPRGAIGAALRLGVVF